MNWSEYVRRHLRGHTQAAIAELAGVSQTAVSRWLKETQGVDAAVAIRFAKAVGDDPLTALVAGGYLTPAEAKTPPAPEPNLSQLTNDQLLELVRSRMIGEDGEGHVPAATKTASDELAQEKYGQAARTGRRQKTDEPGEGA